MFGFGRGYEIDSFIFHSFAVYRNPFGQGKHHQIPQSTAQCRGSLEFPNHVIGRWSKILTVISRIDRKLHE